MKKVTLQFSRFRSHLRSNPGQSMVEFAIALPILLLLVFGIIEFGRILQAWLAIENGARFGVAMLLQVIMTRDIALRR